MKIGYFCNSTNWGNKKTYNQILNEIREIASYCDQNNWDSIWFSEHHFSHEGMEICPNPILLSSDIAARTNKIRILPLLHSRKYKKGIILFIYPKKQEKRSLIKVALKNKGINNCIKKFLLTNFG